VSSPGRSGAQIRLLLVEDVAQVAQYVRGLLDAQTLVKLVDVTSDGAQVVDQIGELQPDVLVVDALLRGSMSGLQVAEEVRQAGHDLPIIALTVPGKPVAVGEGMGIVHVLTMPFSGFDFLNLVKELHDTHRARAPEAMSRVYAVFGAKGGVGTTTLAYNIGASIANNRLQRVALVDGSLQFGDLRALLGVAEDAPSILHLPTTRLTQADLDEVAFHDRSTLDIFLAPPRPEMAEMVSAQDMAKLLTLLRRVYNVVIIDTPTGVNDTSLAFFDAADAIVLVFSFDEATLRQTRAMSATFEQIGYRDKLRFLLNRSDSTGGMRPDDIVARIGRPADFSVVSDGKLVLESNNRGEPFVLTNPGARVSRDVTRVAEYLATAPLGAGAARW
jgi:pilus assembly protein CpaE